MFTPHPTRGWNGEFADCRGGFASWSETCRLTLLRAEAVGSGERPTAGKMEVTKIFALH